MKKKPKKEMSLKEHVTADEPKSSGNYFRFHSHLVTDNGGIDVKEERELESNNSVHRAIVPNTPLLSRRFYDWPPNPFLSKVEIY